ncbi:Vinculin [Schistosoma japonicum]|nr:Vinculin [Schistosoma japonicum]
MHACISLFQGNGSEAEHVVNTLSTKLNQLSRLCKGLSLRDGSAAASGGDQHQHLCNPLFRLARTLEGKLVQAQRWLADPRGPLRHVGLEACRSLAQGAKSIMMSVFDDDALTNSTMNGNSKEEDRETSDACLEACEHVERVSGRLFAMSSQPITEENEIGQQDLAVAISRSLAYIWQTLEKLLTRQIAEVYTDLVGPLRQLVESASPSSGNLPDQNNYNVKTKEFLAQCNQLVSTGELAAATKLSDVWRSDALRCLTSQLNELGSQVVLAGRAVVLSADPNLQLQPGGASLKQATSDHFLLMRQHWTDTAERMRTLVDEAVDANAFIAAQETGMLRDSAKTESSIVEVSTTGVVEATTRIARRANRVLQLITREADNSEDPLYVDRMNDAVKALRSTITPMVNDAKGLVTNIEDPRMHEQWRLSNRNLLTAVNSVKQAVSPFNNPITYYHEHCHPMSSSMHKNGIASANKSSINNSCNNTHINNNNNNNSISSSKSSQSSAKEIMSSIPLREMQEMSITDEEQQQKQPGTISPNDAVGSVAGTVLVRPSSPDTEADDEFNFPPPEENQPIMAAAHALHHETRLWSSRDNELIAATKRMAALMAQLSQIVRGEYGTKKDLINVSMAIAEASLDVNQCAKVLAKECTDRRIRSNLSHLSDRILTIGNQLKILSTVKATMLGTQDDSWFEAPLRSELDCGSVEDQENTESLVGNAQNLMQSVIEALHVAEGASIKMRVHSGHKFVWHPRTTKSTFNHHYRQTLPVVR